jgi:hypothetical protein
MALSTTEQLDYLWKKLGYGVTKTDTAANKLAFNEGIPSPLLLRADKIWAQAADIPISKPNATSSVVEVYKDGVGSWSSTVKCIEDLGSSDNRTWKTNSTDWIPPEFGSTYLVSVYIDINSATSPQTTGTQIFAAGASGVSNDEWFFDYQSGVLHFIGINLPTAIASGVTGKSIFISGARYIGSFGFSESASITTANLGNLNITGNTVSSINTNDNIVLDPNGTGNILLIANTSITGTISINSTADSNYGAISIGNATIAANTTSGAAGIFTGIGSSAISNITIGTSSTTVKVPGILAMGSIVGNSANITITTGTLIDTFPIATYRTAKYIIKVSNSTTYEALEALVIHDGIDSYITVYGYISSDDTDIVSVSTDISGGNVNLYASRMVATATVLNYLATYIRD